MQFDLFETFVAPDFDDEPEDLSARELEKIWRRENRDAFFPLVTRFCDLLGIALSVTDDFNVVLKTAFAEVKLELSFLRWENTSTGELGSVHSSELELVLFTQLFPYRKRAKDFSVLFKPFAFEPK